MSGEFHGNETPLSYETLSFSLFAMPVKLMTWYTPSIKFWQIYFYMAQWSKASSVLINLINATQTFYWSSNVLTGNFLLLVLFIVTTHANSKYSYYFLIFEFLKYIYQNYMEGVEFKGIKLPMKPLNFS